MTKQKNTKQQASTFRKGQSGNPKGRPKGTTNHDTELRQAEDQAMELAVFVCDVIKEAAIEALTTTGDQGVIPLIKTITDAAAEWVKEGKIGPSPIALLRNWYEGHQEDEEGEFFAHVGLPRDCTWEAFQKHYTTRKRIDNARHAADLFSYPPIAEEIKMRLA